MTKLDTPLVSVLVPVFNEELFLRETLESIESQDYQNLEILISDNHSSDHTVKICREYASKDPRITLFEQSQNIGVGPNHILLVGKAKGKYLMFAAGHDKWSSNFITVNVTALESHPNAVVAYGTPCWIDEKGHSFNRYSGWYDTRGLSTVSRFFFIFWGKPNPILGLFRSLTFPDLTDKNFIGADLTILCSLALKGDFIHTFESSFIRRQNRPLEDHKKRIKRYVSNDMKIKSSNFSKFFPLLLLPVRIIHTVIVSSVSKPTKILLLILLLPAIPIKYFVERTPIQDN